MNQNTWQGVYPFLPFLTDTEMEGTKTRPLKTIGVAQMHQAT